MKRCTDRAFKYTPVSEQGPGYLKRKFEAIRRQQQAQQQEAAAKVVAKIEPKARKA